MQMETTARYMYSIPKQIQPSPFISPKAKTKPFQLISFKLKTTTSSSFKKDEWTPSSFPSPTLVTPKRRRTTSPTKKSRHSRITIATSSDWRWSGNWTCDYVFSLDELGLADLAEDAQKDAQVLINLAIDKASHSVLPPRLISHYISSDTVYVTVLQHASFGFSVHGRIITSFGKKCINCSCSYCREINTTFDVWLLPSSRDNSSLQLPEIGGDDPSVIYVNPGCVAELDSLVQDTIRLTCSVKETCSEVCEKSEQRWECAGAKDSTFSAQGRWSALLKLRNKAR